MHIKGVSVTLFSENSQNISFVENAIYFSAKYAYQFGQMYSLSQCD